MYMRVGTRSPPKPGSQVSHEYGCQRTSSVRGSAAGPKLSAVMTTAAPA